MKFLTARGQGINRKIFFNSPQGEGNKTFEIPRLTLKIPACGRQEFGYMILLCKIIVSLI
jgi:hypothetical protein